MKTEKPRCGVCLKPLLYNMKDKIWKCAKHSYTWIDFQSEG